jgi:hypothetical protein
MPVDEQTSRNNWLIISGKTGKVERLKEMLAQGADINASDGYCTALMYAASRGHLDYVAQIVRLGADVGRKSSDGKTAAEFAAEAGHRTIVDLLFAHGAPYGPLEEARNLLASIAGGLDVNARDEHGITPLMRAADRGQERLIEILLDHGAETQPKTRFGYTAMMMAVYNGHAPIVERLFRAGATLPSDPVLLPAAELLESSGVAGLISRYTGSPWERVWDRRVRVDETELTTTDLERHPFWEVCGDEHDNVHILRPVPFVEPLDHDVIGRVRVEFTLADGTTFPGFASFDGFSGEPFARYARPHLFHGEWIGFYDTFDPPPREKIDGVYRALGKEPSQVFPIRVRSTAALKDQPQEGVLEGFAWYDCRTGGSQTVEILR